MPNAVIHINNSFSRIEGLGREEMKAIWDTICMKEEDYGVQRLSLSDIPRLIKATSKFFFRDMRQIKRIVLGPRGPYQRINQITDALQRREPVFIRGFVLKRQRLISIKGTFATGLLDQVQNYLTERKIPYSLDDQRIVPPATPGLLKLNLGDIVPYQEQLDAAATLAVNVRGCVSMPTGAGKSITTALFLNLLQRRALVIVPTLQLKSQLTQTFQKLFGETSKNITVENIDSPRLKDATDYDVLVVDESHHSCSNTYKDLNKTSWNNMYFRMFTTATAYRSREAENIVLESITGPVMYRLEDQVAVEKKLILPIEVYYYDLPITKLPPAESSLADYRKVYETFVVNNEHRHVITTHIMKSLYARGLSTLTLVKEIAHGERIAQLTGCAFANGQSDETPWLIEKFSDGGIKTLCATSQICGEGCDTRAAEWLVLAGGGRSRNQLVQAIGRVRRKFGNKTSGKVIMFRDASHRFLLDHFEAQCHYIEDEYGIKPCKLDYPEKLIA